MESSSFGGAGSHMQSASLSAMVASWQHMDIERCLVQACYQSQGFVDDAEITWLYLPRCWQATVSQEVVHTPTEIEPSECSVGSDAEQVVSLCGYSEASAMCPQNDGVSGDSQRFPMQHSQCDAPMRLVHEEKITA